MIRYQLPDILNRIMADEVKPAIIAGDFEITVIRSQPSVFYGDDIHMALSHGQVPWGLLSSIAGITSHPDL